MSTEQVPSTNTAFIEELENGNVLISIADLCRLQAADDKRRNHRPEWLDSTEDQPPAQRVKCDNTAEAAASIKELSETRAITLPLKNDENWPTTLPTIREEIINGEIRAATEKVSLSVAEGRDQCNSEGSRKLTRNAIRPRVCNLYTSDQDSDGSLTCDEKVEDNDKSSESSKEKIWEIAEYVADLMPVEHEADMRKARVAYRNVMTEKRWRWGDKCKWEDAKNNDKPRKVCERPKWKGCHEYGTYYCGDKPSMYHMPWSNLKQHAYMLDQVNEFLRPIGQSHSTYGTMRVYDTRLSEKASNLAYSVLAGRYTHRLRSILQNATPYVIDMDYNTCSHYDVKTEEILYCMLAWGQMYDQLHQFYNGLDEDSGVIETSITRLPVPADVFKLSETSYYDGEIYPTEAGLWSLLPENILHLNFFQILFRLYAFDLYTGDQDYDNEGNYHNTDMPIEMMHMVKALNCDVQYYCKDGADTTEYSTTYKWICATGEHIAEKDCEVSDKRKLQLAELKHEWIDQYRKKFYVFASAYTTAYISMYEQYSELVVKNDGNYTGLREEDITMLQNHMVSWYMEIYGFDGCVGCTTKCATRFHLGPGGCRTIDWILASVERGYTSHAHFLNGYMRAVITNLMAEMKAEYEKKTI